MCPLRGGRGHGQKCAGGQAASEGKESGGSWGFLIWGPRVKKAHEKSQTKQTVLNSFLFILWCFLFLELLGEVL